MKKPIVVSCDSACDLDPVMREQYGIQITHMYVHEGEKTFQDGIDITPDDIFRTYEEQGILPKTSAIPPEEYYQFFKEHTDQGCAVVHKDCPAEFQAPVKMRPLLQGIYKMCMCWIHWRLAVAADYWLYRRADSVMPD